MSKLLSIFGSVGIVGAVVVPTAITKTPSDLSPVEFINSVDKTQLKAKIDEAQELLANNNKSKQANLNLEIAIKRAEATFNDSNAIQSKVDEMVKRLEAAIKLFKDSADVSNRENLEAKINEAYELLFTVHRSDRATGLFRAAINRAELVLTNPHATPETIELAIKTLDYEMAMYKGSV